MKQITVGVLVFSLLLPLSAFGALAGDVDGGGTVALPDAILAIRVASGAGAGADAAAEISGDDRIGMAEAVYVLQCMSGLRPACDPGSASLWDIAQWENGLWAP